jgi:glycosyltransferase involved in cell wall biosynthesis
MKILFGVHHPLDARLGAPGASLSIGHELEQMGHQVEFFGYDQAFGRVTRTPSILRALFPWRLGAFLARRANDFDVLDITTGDAYLWAAGARRRRQRPRLVTRSNGLEHLAHRALIDQVRKGHADLSWRYPIYNGGVRLWEVKASLRLADGVVLLNEVERSYAIEALNLERQRTCVIPHGLDESMLNAEVPLRYQDRSEGEARLCFIGNWTHQKGTSEIVAAAEKLHQCGRPFTITVLGSGRSEPDVLADFPEATRTRVKVVPRYPRQELPRLLSKSDILIFPSRFEGFGLAILEAMACGVVPVTTPVGIAEDVIKPGHNGFLVPVNGVDQLVAIVLAVANDSTRLCELGRNAYRSAQRFSWLSTAKATLMLYESLVARA